MNLSKYIDINHNGNAADFGRSMGVDRNAVYRWIDKGFIVVDGVLYSPRRVLNQ